MSNRFADIQRILSTEDNEFRQWLDELSADIEQLPEDAFQGVDAFRQTGVKTRLVVINKP